MQGADDPPRRTYDNDSQAPQSTARERDGTATGTLTTQPPLGRGRTTTDRPTSPAARMANSAASSRRKNNATTRWPPPERPGRSHQEIAPRQRAWPTITRKGIITEKPPNEKTTAILRTPFTSSFEIFVLGGKGAGYLILTRAGASRKSPSPPGIRGRIGKLK